MNKLRAFLKLRSISVFFLLASTFGLFLYATRSLRAEAAAQNSSHPEGRLIADFRRVEVASVSDALEQLTGKRMYMSHRMHPLFTTKFAGLARTVLLKKDEGNSDPAALNGMLEAIDQGSTNWFFVWGVKEG